MSIGALVHSRRLAGAARTRGLSGQLRAHTRADHEAAEASLDLASLRDRTDLAALLSRWRRVWHDVERAASMPAACPQARDELRLPARQAEAWLRSDLVALGSDEATASRVEPNDELHALLGAPASTWGVAYVLRGSRLGGSVLAPLVRAALALDTTTGTAFFASAGTDPGREWVAFRCRMDAAELTPEQVELAIAAARWTFRWVAAETFAPSGPGLRVLR